MCLYLYYTQFCRKDQLFFKFLCISAKVIIMLFPFKNKRKIKMFEGLKLPDFFDWDLKGTGPSKNLISRR